MRVPAGRTVNCSLSLTALLTCVCALGSRVLAVLVCGLVVSFGAGAVTGPLRDFRGALVHRF